MLAAGPPDQLAQPYVSLQLHQTMHVQGLATTATARVTDFGAKLTAAAAAEVVELLQVRGPEACHAVALHDTVQVSVLRLTC